MSENGMWVWKIGCSAQKWSKIQFFWFFGKFQFKAFQCRFWCFHTVFRSIFTLGQNFMIFAFFPKKCDFWWNLEILLIFQNWIKFDLNAVWKRLTRHLKAYDPYFQFLKNKLQFSRFGHFLRPVRHVPSRACPCVKLACSASHMSYWSQKNGQIERIVIYFSKIEKIWVISFQMTFQTFLYGI